MKVLASDYDGTLNMNRMVSKENIEAIQAFRKAGNKFGIVTGRSMESIRYDIEQFQIEVDFVVGNNGGAIYNHLFEEIETKLISFSKAMEIKAYLEQEQVVSIVINDGYYRAVISLDQETINEKYKDIKTTKAIEEILKEEKIAQIVATTKNEEQNQRICDYINTNYKEYMIAFPNVSCVDIVPYNSSKQKGLLKALECLNINQTAIFAIGDSYNDLPMVEANYGFTMAHSPQDVKEKGKQSVVSVKEAIDVIMKL